MKLNQLKNLNKIAILWYAKEGSSTLNFLLKLWIDKQKITILDSHKIDNLEKNNKLIYWEIYLDNLGNFDLIFKSPWISPYNPKMSKVRDKLISQAEIFFDNYNWKVIWVTATKGKSTTSTLIYETLKEAWYKVKLVWNIWNPVLDEIDIFAGEIYDFVVYELSSYMLEMFQPKCFIAVLWNIYTDHLDWHWNSFENYKNAKLNIIKKSQNILIRDEFRNFINPLKWQNIYTFWLNWDYSYKDWSFFIWDKFIFDDEKILLKWEHNMINICSVLWVLDILIPISQPFYRKGIQGPQKEKGVEILINVLSNFSWLPHRMQNIWEYNWITFIDDAISTTPESTIEAIKTFWEKIWTIFLWWTDRWYDFKNLGEYLKIYNIKNIVLFPETWIRILEEINKLNLKNLNILETKSMKEAVEFAFKYTNNWKICLLSTASPSYFLWKNFEEKWDEFKKEIKNFVS